MGASVTMRRRRGMAPSAIPRGKICKPATGSACGASGRDSTLLRRVSRRAGSARSGPEPVGLARGAAAAQAETERERESRPARRSGGGERRRRLRGRGSTVVGRSVGGRAHASAQPARRGAPAPPRRRSGAPLASRRRQASTRLSSSTGTSGARALGGGGWPSARRRTSSATVDARYGGAPVRSSYRTTPSAYTSAAAVASSPGRLLGREVGGRAEHACRPVSAACRRRRGRSRSRRPSASRHARAAGSAA